MINIKEMLTMKQAAEQLGLNVETLKRARAAGKLTAIRLGRGYKISQQALDAYVRRQTIEAAEDGNGSSN